MTVQCFGDGDQKLRFGCVQMGGDCPVGARVDDMYCVHPRYCSAKIMIKGEMKKDE